MNALVAQLTALPPVPVFVDQQRIIMQIACDPRLFRIDRMQAVSLVAGRIEADDRAKIAPAANDALREPALIPLMAHA